MLRGRWRVVAATSDRDVAVLPCRVAAATPVRAGRSDQRMHGPIEVKDVAAPVDIAGTEVAPGEKATVEGEDGSIDVAVRAPGSSADPIYIDWEDMDVRGEQAGRDVTVEGSTCPGQQS